MKWLLLALLLVLVTVLTLVECALFLFVGYLVGLGFQVSGPKVLIAVPYWLALACGLAWTTSDCWSAVREAFRCGG